MQHHVNLLIARLRADIFGHPIARRLVSGAGWLFGVSLIAQVIVVAKGLFLARSLGPELFGTFGLIIAFISLLDQFTDSRTGDTVTQFITKFMQKGERDRASAIVKAAILVDVTTGLLAYIIISVVAMFVAHQVTKSSSYAGLIQLYALVILAGIPASAYLALQRLARRHDQVAQQSLVFAALELAGIVVTVQMGGSLPEIMVIVVLVAVLRSVACFWFISEALRTLELPGWSRTPLCLLKEDRRALTRFLFSTNIMGLIKGAHTNLDMLVVGFWLGPAPSGIYRLARNIVPLVNIPVAPLFQVSYPEFSKLWHQGRLGLMRSLIVRVVGLTGVMGIVCLIAIVLLAPWLIGPVVGEAYVPAVPAMILLSIGTILYQIAQYTQPILLSMGKAGRLTSIYGFAVLIELIMLVALVPAFGGSGAALANIGFAIAYTLTGFLPAWRGLNSWSAEPREVHEVG